MVCVLFIFDIGLSVHICTQEYTKSFLQALDVKQDDGTENEIKHLLGSSYLFERMVTRRLIFALL